MVRCISRSPPEFDSYLSEFKVDRPWQTSQSVPLTESKGQTTFLTLQLALGLVSSFFQVTVRSSLGLLFFFFAPLWRRVRKTLYWPYFSPEVMTTLTRWGATSWRVYKAAFIKLNAILDLYLECSAKKRYLFVPTASISSMNTIEGACSSATRNISRTSLGPSPFKEKQKLFVLLRKQHNNNGKTILTKTTMLTSTETERSMGQRDKSKER